MQKQMQRPTFSTKLPSQAQCYLVGGAVRDRLLNYPFTEHDWMVVGASPSDMLEQGFEQVGKDFPVFLHPETKEEYALARTERKSGAGYHGFSCSIENVTLEEDLLRRDLTINAIAQDADGNLIDPYNGAADIKACVLRHISAAFAEDPLRVLRVARFAARYHHLGFTVAEETVSLMREINDSGELNHLTPERIWKELSRALMEKTPAAFFQTLLACGALYTLFPEVDKLHGVPQPEQYHPEIDCFVHLCLCLNMSAKLNHDLPTRYAVLMHDLGKGTTPEDILPSHIGHEARSERLAKTLSKRIKAPNDCAHLGIMTGKWHTHIHRAFDLKPATLLKLFRGTDAYRRPARFLQMLDACEADSRGRTGYEDNSYPQKDYTAQALEAANNVDTQALLDHGYTGEKLGAAIERTRLKNVATYKNNFN